MSKRYKKKDSYYPKPITDMKHSPGVAMVCINPVTREIVWHPRTVPVGLETFWD